MRRQKMAESIVGDLDARIIPPVAKHPTIFKKFDDLKAGEAFILVNDHDPKPLYYQFAAERVGEFSWEYLETGPEVFRVKIGKTNEVETEGERSIPEHHCGKC